MSINEIIANRNERVADDARGRLFCYNMKELDNENSSDQVETWMPSFRINMHEDDSDGDARPAQNVI